MQVLIKKRNGEKEKEKEKEKKEIFITVFSQEW